MHRYRGTTATATLRRRRTPSSDGVAIGHCSRSLGLRSTNPSTDGLNSSTLRVGVMKYVHWGLVRTPAPTCPCLYVAIPHSGDP